jgi:hypothetical protein
MANRIFSISFALVLGLALTACNDSGDDSSSSSSSSAEDKQAALEKNAIETKSGGADKLGGKQGKKSRQKMMKKRMEMMKKRQEMKKKAFAAGEKAEKKGDTPCEKAFYAAVAVDESMRKQMGKKVPEQDPDQSSFVKSCEKLPKEMQKCLIPSYAGKNRQKCAKVHKDMDQGKKDTLKAAMKNLR